MAKRVLIVAIVVAVALLLAAPAFAFNGYRDTYTTSDYCAGCHYSGNPFDAPAVYDEWVSTTHASDVANEEPISSGPGCGGCHSSNYAPAKASPIPTPTPSPTATIYSTVVEGTQGSGESAFSESHIGCSACHWGAKTGLATADQYGSDPYDTAHQVPIGNMANADICGQCHTRYSNSLVAYANWDGSTAKQQYTIGTFNPVGVPTPIATPTAWPVQPITDFLAVPNPTSPQKQNYYTAADGVTKLPYNGNAHSEGAGQYEEWAGEGHAAALTTLTSDPVWGFLDEPTKESCLECHSEDFRIMKDNGLDPTSTDVKYGVTCQACHDPHKVGEQTSVWNKDDTPQLTMPRQQLCVQCHTAELGPSGVAEPGSDVHNPMKEMMNGTGAIDVPQGSPSVHKGKCVQCHMVPTGYMRSTDGIDHPAGTAGNHVFAIITPDTAANSTLTLSSPTQIKNMPYSACSTCHSRPGDPDATWLQATLDDRQEAMTNWIAQVTDALNTAALNMGYGDIGDPAEDNITAAHDSLWAASGQGADISVWSSSELSFMKGYTNRSYVQSEGSFGIHNWDYARTVVLTALEEAQAAQAAVKDLSGITIVPDPSTASIAYGDMVLLTGAVTGFDTNTWTGGMAKLWRKNAGASNFVPVDQWFVGSDGTYLLGDTPKVGATYKVEFMGNAQYDPITSDTVDVAVTWRVTCKASPASLKKNAKVKFSGTVSPATGGTVNIQKKSGSAWNDWLTATVTSSGSWSVSKKMTSKGTFYFRAEVPASPSGLREGITPQVKVVVK